jgi:hypothetical protein
MALTGGRDKTALKEVKGVNRKVGNKWMVGRKARDTERVDRRVTGGKIAYKRMG